MAATCSKLDSNSGKFGSTWPQWAFWSQAGLGSKLAQLGSSFAQLGSAWAQVDPNLVQTCHEKFINKFNYTIDLISDEDESLCKQFDVLKLKKMYGKEHIGIVRSTFVISPDGDILKQWDKVKVDGHAEEVLDFVKSL